MSVWVDSRAPDGGDAHPLLASAWSKRSHRAHVGLHSKVETPIPTIPLAIGSDVIEPDLDTGSHGTFLDARCLSSEAATWFEGRHLGQVFYWTPERAAIALLAAGSRTERSLPARFVTEWTESPFVRTNRARRALAGRDLLRAFGPRLCLATPELPTTLESAG